MPTGAFAGSAAGRGARDHGAGDARLLREAGRGLESLVGDGLRRVDQLLQGGDAGIRSLDDLHLPLTVRVSVVSSPFAAVMALPPALSLPPLPSTFFTAAGLDARASDITGQRRAGPIVQLLTWRHDDVGEFLCGLDALF